MFAVMDYLSQACFPSSILSFFLFFFSEVGRLHYLSPAAFCRVCGFKEVCCCRAHTHTHHIVVMGCVGCGCAAAVALTTVSLFSQRKAADVTRGSDRGEWNVGAIFGNTHTHKQPHGSSVHSCCLSRFHPFHTVILHGKL